MRFCMPARCRSSFACACSRRARSCSTCAMATARCFSACMRCISANCCHRWYLSSERSALRLLCLMRSLRVCCCITNCQMCEKSVRRSGLKRYESAPRRMQFWTISCWSLEDIMITVIPSPCSRRMCSRTCMPFMPCIITSHSTRLNCSLGGMPTFSRSSCRLSSPPPAHVTRKSQLRQSSEMTEAEKASSSTSKMLSFWILTWLSTTASSSSTCCSSSSSKASGSEMPGIKLTKSRFGCSGRSHRRQSHLTATVAPLGRHVVQSAMHPASSCPPTTSSRSASGMRSRLLRRPLESSRSRCPLESGRSSCTARSLAASTNAPPAWTNVPPAPVLPTMISGLDTASAIT
mmetsp:Transcript_11132/g.27887  ORF Transcript_11132/g.27887 Transcript_11132/m.27887 type:complete len:348 (+) Transcript_11132:686-1729(+)